MQKTMTTIGFWAESFDDNFEWFLNEEIKVYNYFGGKNKKEKASRDEEMAERGASEYAKDNNNNRVLSKEF